MEKAREQLRNSYRIIHFLKQVGVETAFLAPGLRCVALYQSIKQLGLNIISGWDERSLAFQALGHGHTKKSPVLVACTSGTAGAHFYPAIIEAYQSRQPLIVLTCDRPRRLRDSDANQTINQENFFGKYTCFRHSLELYQKQLLSQILNSAARALAQQQRPIHFNLAYEEPLLGPPMAIPGELPFATPVAREVKTVGPETLGLLGLWKRPFIVIGETYPYHPVWNRNQQALITWLQAIKTPFFADITSGIKTQTNYLHHSITSLDSPFVLDYLQNHVDGILHIGGKVVSQNYQRMLDCLPRPKVIQMSPYFADRILPQRILHDQKLHLFQAEKLPTWDFSHSPLLEHEHKRRHLFTHLGLNSPTHYYMVQEVYQNLRKDDVLIIGNSTPVRSFNDYFYPVAKSVSLQWQRGVSGIEGIIARAKGTALAHSGRVICILGDLSAYHDFSSLIGDLPKNLKILILNNQRGGLFSRPSIPHYREELEDIIETPHSLKFSTLCKYWPTWDGEANSIPDFLEGSRQIWEFLINHQKDMQEWKELL